MCIRKYIKKIDIKSNLGWFLCEYWHVINVEPKYPYIFIFLLLFWGFRITLSLNLKKIPSWALSSLYLIFKLLHRIWIIPWKNPSRYSVSHKKWWLRKSLKFTLFSPLLGHFNKFFLLHLNIRYKRITLYVKIFWRFHLGWDIQCLFQGLIS